MADTPAGGYRLTLLGGWKITHGPQTVQMPASAQRLVAFVSLNDHVSRTYVAGTLWPEVTDQHAQGSLRSTIWRVSRLCPDLLVSSGETLAVADDVVVDVRELRGLFADLLSATRGTRTDPSDAPSQAIDVGSLPDWLWGDLLPGWYEDWVLLERERLRQMRVHALEAMTRNLAELGRFAEALEVGMVAVGVAPLRESAHREVIRIHLAEGNLAEALRQFEVCAQLLRQDLGLEPSELMIDLMRPVIDGSRAGP
ncbi:bacterial transcriptional activator domain-containing protein [Microlunatus sp. Gsoil 973]|jgi:DNA-binding SARP family transcriptional activator|uniref:AfsR/SARP family transcriptional regulator n=1 Tax=Microlunatus sp. Gsoil 973 TaxID=2672569 RepID=UPI0012B469CB|nr:bacterial transcriptional activator domain-containing protein [Microlunatus sp. Gsoil 973]QGN32416.1 SARP family transcriptional regulator [Microlunatus sp. Gsoil 973]